MLPRQRFFISLALSFSPTVVGTSFQPSPSFPALQFLDTIEKGSNAEKAGLKQHDYVLEVTLHFPLIILMGVVMIPIN